MMRYAYKIWIEARRIPGQRSLGRIKFLVVEAEFATSKPMSYFLCTALLLLMQWHYTALTCTPLHLYVWKDLSLLLCHQGQRGHHKPKLIL